MTEKATGAAQFRAPGSAAMDRLSAAATRVFRAVLDVPDRTFLRAVLALVALAYFAGYFSHWATPGNTPAKHPLGWWGWYDQGEYLKAAGAFLVGDLSPAKHFYPPLYPLLGAAFLPWSSGHPFVLVDLLALLWFSYCFLRFARGHLHRLVGTAILVLTVLVDWTLFEHFVIPWTSTATAALIGTGLLAFTWADEARMPTGVRFHAGKVVAVALSLGLIAAARPIDAVPAGILGLGVLVAYFRCAPERRLAVVPTVLVGGTAFAVGPGLFLAFNYLSSGSVLGRYYGAASGNGYHPADLAEKFVSLWLDGYALYAEPNAALVQRYPWLLLALGGVLWALVRGPSALRWCAFALAATFALYLPYGDLLPNSIWRYGNVHYFKWTFPLLALLAAVMVSSAWRGWREQGHWRAALACVVLVPLLLLSTRLAVVHSSVPVQTDGTAAEVRLPGARIDFVDVAGLRSIFELAYFGKHHVWVDGNELRVNRDYRLLPIRKGTRVLFIRPVAGQNLRVQPDPGMAWSGAPVASVGAYRLAMRWPWDFEWQTIPEPQAYELGRRIDFSIQGDGRDYTDEGWSDPEPWGRWSIGKRATLRMRLAQRAAADLSLELQMGAFTPWERCQRVVVIVNGSKVGEPNLCGASGADHSLVRRIPVPAALVDTSGNVRIELLTNDAFSPHSVQLNEDTRVLGVSVRSLTLAPR